MNDHSPFDQLDIIGTTTVLQDLPKRLSPVYLARGADASYYMTVSEADPQHPALSQETAEHFEALVAQGEVLRFDTPIAAQRGHCLVQIEHGAAPEYPPADELPERLFRAHREALERACRALSRGDRSEAEELAWYARRANGDDPLAVLLLISLLRGVVAKEDLRYLEQDLEAYPPRQVEAARQRAREHADLRAIGDLLDAPPNSGVRRNYLDPFPLSPDFLLWARRITSAPPRRRASA